MTDVMVERHWERGLSCDDIGALFESSAGCLSAHRCEWCGSLLSSDTRDLFCHFTGPDAESVRIALYEAGSPRGRAWSCTVHDAPGVTAEDLVHANVLVSRHFEQPVALADIQAIEDAGAGCLDTHRVRFVRTFFARDRRRMICLYRAPDAESVRLAQREAGMPVERVWAVKRLLAP
jgi:hypothetical protein